MATLVEVEDLHCSYNGRGQVLHGLSLTLGEGERVGLAGHTGCGKTTLLRTIMGLGKADSGTIRVEGLECRQEKDYLQVRRTLGYLFQNPDDQLFCPSLLEDVAFGPLNLGVSRREARARAEECLALVGLAGFEDRLTHCLSGGEKRLASLAGVLAMRPKALLLDEPTTGLDPESKQRVADVLNHLDLALLVVSHEWDFLAQVARSHYILNHGHLHPAKEAPHVHRHVHPLGGFPHAHDE